MDQELYNRTHKRIVDLNPFSDDGEDPCATLTRDTVSQWVAPVDHEVTGAQNNSYAIPVDRLMILGPDRKVMAKNLPSFISYVGEVVNLNRAVAGDISKVYKEVVNGIVTYYRYLPDETVQLEKRYVPIANNLKLVDGDGTVVTDQPSVGHSRKLDVDIAVPTAHVDTVLGISGGKLVHSLSAAFDAVAQSGTFPAVQPNTTNTDFSDASKNYFYVSKSSFDSTGHLSEKFADSRIVFPATQSAPGTAGIVNISATAPEPIGNNASAGNSASGIVSAADHIHSASVFQFTNYPSAGQLTTVSYGMSDDRRLDFSNILGTGLPDQKSAVTEPRILSYNGTKSEWKSVAELFTHQKAESSTGTTPVATNTTVAAIGGLTAGYLYLIRLAGNFGLQPISGNDVQPRLSIYTVTVNMGGEIRKFNVNAANSTSPQCFNVCSIYLSTGTYVSITATCESGVVNMTVDEATAIRLR